MHVIIKKYLIVFLVFVLLLSLVTILKTPLHCMFQNAITSTLIPLYVITPTYARPVQLAELTRIYQALSNVRDVVWIVVEDSESYTEKVSNFLERIKITTGS